MASLTMHGARHSIEYGYYEGESVPENHMPYWSGSGNMIREQFEHENDFTADIGLYVVCVTRCGLDDDSQSSSVHTESEMSATMALASFCVSILKCHSFIMRLFLSMNRVNQSYFLSFLLVNLISISCITGNNLPISSH